MDTTQISRRQILVVGSCNTDMVIKAAHLPRPGETILGGTFFMNPGGKGANQAVAIARLGGSVTFICKTGSDIFGHQSQQLFEEEGINTSYVFSDSGNPSGVALITVDEKAEKLYLTAEDYRAAQEAAAASKAPPQPEPAAEKTDDVPLNLETARRFAAVLQQEKQLMQDAQGREELDHMQTTTTAICDWLEAHPESLPKARRFAEYYIPTTLKLLHTYNDVQGQQGENAETIRRDIAGILHTLNQAYDTLYDTLLSDVAMDVSSEIAALQGMLANDGLTGREFE